MPFEKLIKRMERSNITFTPFFSCEEDQQTYAQYVNYGTDETIKYWMIEGEIYGELYRKFRSTRMSTENIYSIMYQSEETWRNYMALRFKPYRHYNFQPMRSGETLEIYAIQLYEQLTYQTVMKCKHMVNRRFPWIIAAPDGLVVSNGTIYKGIEIKSTSHLSTTRTKFLCGDAVTKRTHYDEFEVNKKSRTYLQVQICMAVSNLPKWDLIIYFRDNKIKVFEILYDDKFIKQCIAIASTNYFMYYLPMLTKVLK